MHRDFFGWNCFGPIPLWFEATQVTVWLWSPQQLQDGGAFSSLPQPCGVSYKLSLSYSQSSTVARINRKSPYSANKKNPLTVLPLLTFTHNKQDTFHLRMQRGQWKTPTCLHLNRTERPSQIQNNCLYMYAKKVKILSMTFYCNPIVIKKTRWNLIMWRKHYSHHCSVCKVL